MTGKGGRFASWRTRLPVVAVVVACVAAVVAAVTGAANPVSAVQFLMPGHWVYNSAVQSVFHVDGATGAVDARAGGVPGGRGDQVFQGDTSGYVVGSSRITEFGKSSLEVEDTTAPPSRAKPVGVETAGGPYLVYREDGHVVRLGDPHAVLKLGGPIGEPVATRDGTLWLPRTDAGLLCHLKDGADRVACEVEVPKGHGGALSIVGDRLVFVDTTDDTAHLVTENGLGESHDLGVDVPDEARFAGTDVGGKLAILDGDEMHLVDAGLDGEPDEPVLVSLGEGDYSGPVSTGSVVAVVNQTTGTLLTYDGDGEPKKSKKLPTDNGIPRLTRGEDDRVYVDGDEGTHVVVVDTDGDVTDVPIKDGDGEGDKKVPPTGGKDPDAQVSVPPKPADKPKPPQQTSPPPQQEEQQQQQQPPPPPPPPPNPPQVPPTPPGAPTGVNAVAGNAAATVNWGPAPDNRSAITAYRITWAGGETTVGAGARTVNIPGLANGTTYSFAVTAINGIGTGPAAASNPVTPVAPVRPASPPTNVVVNWDQAARTATMTWAPPADLGGGAPGGYYVTGTGWGESSVGGTTWTFDNIQQSGTLTFTVRARTSDSAGRLVEGATATQTVEAQAGGTVTVTRGTPTEDYCGQFDACAWMQVTLSGLAPNTTYTLMPHSSDPQYDNPGAGVTTDANGDYSTERFAYGGVGHTVWVTATSEADGTEVRSNDYVWEAG